MKCISMCDFVQSKIGNGLHCSRFTSSSIYMRLFKFQIKTQTRGLQGWNPVFHTTRLLLPLYVPQTFSRPFALSFLFCFCRCRYGCLHYRTLSFLLLLLFCCWHPSKTSPWNVLRLCAPGLACGQAKRYGRTNGPSNERRQRTLERVGQRTYVFFCLPIQ